MAHVYQRGKQFYLQFRHQGKLYREPAGSYKRDAELLLAKRKVEMRERRFFPDATKICDVTLAEFVTPYLEWARAHKRSWKRDERSLRNLCVHFGTTSLGRISFEQVEHFKRRRLSGELRFGAGRRQAGRATVNRELACLRKLLNLAVDLGVLSENPVAGKVKLLKESGGRTRYLEPEEIERLLAECAGHIRPIVHLGVLSGMRKSEITGLPWEEVDLARGVIRLPGKRTKNGEARIVPLNQEARRILQEARRNRLEGCPWVFHQPDGLPLGSIRTGFEAACRRAKIVALP